MWAGPRWPRGWGARRPPPASAVPRGPISFSPREHLCSFCQQGPRGRGGVSGRPGWGPTAPAGGHGYRDSSPSTASWMECREGSPKGSGPFSEAGRYKRRQTQAFPSSFIFQLCETKAALTLVSPGSPSSPDHLWSLALAYAGSQAQRPPPLPVMQIPPGTRYPVPEGCIASGSQFSPTSCSLCVSPCPTWSDKVPRVLFLLLFPEPVSSARPSLGPLQGELSPFQLCFLVSTTTLARLALGALPLLLHTRPWHPSSPPAASWVLSHSTFQKFKFSMKS